MMWPLSRLWCEVRQWHPNVLWASEWEYRADGRWRKLQLRCSDCDRVQSSRVEWEMTR